MDSPGSGTGNVFQSGRRSKRGSASSLQPAAEGGVPEEDSETKLKELNQELKEWKDKAKKMEAKARTEMDEQINKLSQKEEEAS